MSQDQVEAITERWMVDEDFRARMRAAPLETISSEGYTLSDEEKLALGRMDLSKSDEELAEQASFAT